MSLQNKRFWMAKGSGHISDRETVFDTPSKIEPKRPHQWFVDGNLVDEAEVDFLPNKKQAVEDAKEKSSSGFSNANFTSWENNPNCHSVPNQFIGRLFGSETKPVNFTEKNTSYVSADDSNVDLHEAYNGEVETRSASIGQGFDKDGNVTLMGLTYSRGDAHVRSFGAPFGKGDNTVLSISESYNKDDTNVISFGGFPDERDIISVGRPAADYEQLYNQSSVHLPTIAHEKKLDTSNSDVVASTTQAATVKSENVSKNKQDIKTVRKETPNSFPSNVRSLISTGMLDGVPIKYVSVAREELRGIIKGSGYLCGCQSCNYSKVLNAYEFERHAGCKTKHPNNHIYFENGKTIYQIVQELRSTPESLLFDTIQTVFGAPINQKAFRNWKESYQAATRELQRIYGKEELKL